MARKRAKGEGTIRRRTDGLWEARLSVPGRRTPKSFYGKTQAEALRKREEAKAVDRGIDFDAGRLTLGEYMERWLSGPLKQSVWARTYEDYAWLTRKHITPVLGHVKLKELTAEHLDELYTKRATPAWVRAP
jgi:integrase